MAETGRYFVVAYAAAGAMYALYALSLWRRARKLQRRRGR